MAAQLAGWRAVQWADNLVVLWAGLLAGGWEYHWAGMKVVWSADLWAAWMEVVLAALLVV